MKYVLYIDYLAHCKKSYDYLCMNAKTLEGAIAEAETVLKDISEDVYLTRILKRTGKVDTFMRGLHQESYDAVICKRNAGWHLNDEEHSENEHTAIKSWLARNPADPWFERT